MNKKEVVKNERLHIRIEEGLKNIISENCENISQYIIGLVLKDLNERGLLNDTRK